MKIKHFFYADEKDVSFISLSQIEEKFNYPEITKARDRINYKFSQPVLEINELIESPSHVLIFNRKLLHLYILLMWLTTRKFVFIYWGTSGHSQEIKSICFYDVISLFFDIFVMK